MYDRWVRGGRNGSGKRCGHLVQLDIVWEDRPANHAKTTNCSARRASAPAILVVLPEMFDTGFSFGKTNDTDGRTLQYLQELSAGLGRPCRVRRTVIGPDGAAATARPSPDPMGR